MIVVISASNLVIDVIVEDYEACYIDVYRNCKSSREKTLTGMSDNEVIELLCDEYRNKTFTQQDKSFQLQNIKLNMS